MIRVRSGYRFIILLLCLIRVGLGGGVVEGSHGSVDYLECHRFEPQPYPIYFLVTTYYVLKHELTNLILSISFPKKSRNYNYGDEKNKEKKLTGLENWYQERNWHKHSRTLLY